MSDDLFSYLDVSGPEYSYLGHFRERQWLECGHNELGMEQQIDAGSIPDLHAAGHNQPAESEPGNISAAANAPNETMTQPAASGGQSSGLVKGALEAPIKDELSSGIKSGIKSLFG